MPGAALRAFCLTVSLLLCAVPALHAQSIGVAQSEILVLDTERVLAQTMVGQRLLAELQQERDALIAKNEQIGAELEAEEKALTKLRSEKSAEEFRKLADAFDEKVQQIRANSERAGLSLERQRETLPLRFMRLVEPVLIDLMRDAGGRVILESRSVLLRVDGIDITDAAIARINAEIGDGQPDPAAQ